MKRQWKLILCLALILATLSACSGPTNSPQVFDQATQNLGPTSPATPTPPPGAGGDPQSGQSIFDSNPYDAGSEGFTDGDPLGEEDYGDDGVYDESADMDPYVAAEDATVYPFAGSTPIPLDPVDMPSPTPRAQLVFATAPYAISSLGLTFEAPQGWVPDESVSEMFTLTEPDSQVKDKQPGIIKIYATPVTSNYTEGNLKTEVQDRLKAISSTNFEQWDPSLTASRHLMGGKGVYANYSGTMANGVKVGGRIHCTCIDKVLYCIEIVYPLGYKEDYLELFSKMRSSIKKAE